MCACVCTHVLQDLGMDKCALVWTQVLTHIGMFTYVQGWMLVHRV